MLIQASRLAGLAAGPDATAVGLNFSSSKSFSRSIIFTERRGSFEESILIQSDPDLVTSSGERVLVTKSGWASAGYSHSNIIVVPLHLPIIKSLNFRVDTSKQPIRTLHLGHVTGYQPIRDQYSLTGL
eukprot:sb/3475416/